MRVHLDDKFKKYIYARLTLTALFDKKKDYEKALEIAKSAVEMNPDDSETYSRLGYTNSGSEKFEESIETYSRALTIKSI